MLILKAVSLGPLHAMRPPPYPAAISKDRLNSSKARLSAPRTPRTQADRQRVGEVRRTTQSQVIPHERREGGAARRSGKVWNQQWPTSCRHPGPPRRRKRARSRVRLRSWLRRTLGAAIGTERESEIPLPRGRHTKSRATRQYRAPRLTPSRIEFGAMEKHEREEGKTGRQTCRKFSAGRSLRGAIDAAASAGGFTAVAGGIRLGFRNGAKKRGDFQRVERRMISPGLTTMRTGASQSE